MANPNYNLLTADGGLASEEHRKNVEANNAKAAAASQKVVNKYSNKGTTSTGGGGIIEQPVAEPTFDWEAYMLQLQREAQARADAAYQRNMERIASAYGSAASSLQGNYDSTVGRLNAAKNKSLGDVNTDAEKSLQEAYINNMLTRKNLNQRLSAMGYNGGATETTMANLENQYGSSRTGINETLNRNISDLNMTYGDNLAAALQSYNSAMANLDLQRMQMEMQAENARQNAMDSSMSASFGMDSSYLSALQAALKNQANYSYDPTKATNDYVAGQVQQAQPTSESNAYALWMAQQLLGGGTNSTDVSRYLQSKGYTAQTINDILKQLGA